MPKPMSPQLKADILIIDDIPENLRLLNQILSKEYKVRLAPSGEKGLDAARSTPPDLILLDVMMPGLNGYEVAAQLKAGEQTGEIPIIFVSALDDTESKVQGFSAGGVDYITKPFQELEVLARVKTHLSLRALNRRLQEELVERKRAEDALRQREHDFSTLVENASDMIVRFDSNLRHIYCNPAVERQLGVPIDQLLGKTFLELGPVTEQTRLSYQTLQRALETGSEQDFERDILTPTGLKHLQTRIVPEFAPDGQIESILAMSRDVTERYQAEIALRASNAKLEALINVSPLAILLLDSNEKIQIWNPAAEKIFGWSAQEVLGGPNPIVPASQQTEYAALASQINQGQVMSGFETVRQRKDGSLIAVSISSANVNADGVIAGRMAIIADITERKNAEEAVARGRKLLSTILDVLPVGVCLNDETGYYRMMNGAYCAIYEYEREEMLGKHYSVIMPPDQVALANAHYARLLTGDIGIPAERKRQRKDGSLIYIEAANALVDDVDGQRMVITTVHDITDRKKNEEEIKSINAELEQRVLARTSELEMALKELESISYTVSHDLRAPLRAIVGYSRIIRDDYAAGIQPEGVRQLDVIRENALVMGRMVDGLLSFMQLNRKALNLQLVEMDQLVQQTLKALEEEQTGRKIELAIHELPPCKGDGELLFNVWYNLLANALKFSRVREVANLEVGCRQDENNQPVYYVKDNGVGFSMNYYDKLFKVFHRLHHADEFEGLGMGLALTQRIILRHGGRIWAEAQEGRGATFFFTVG